MNKPDFVNKLFALGRGIWQWRHGGVFDISDQAIYHLQGLRIFGKVLKYSCSGNTGIALGNQVKVLSFEINDGWRENVKLNLGNKIVNQIWPRQTTAFFYNFQDLLKKINILRILYEK